MEYQVILAAVVGGVGASLVASATWSFLRGRATLRWPTTSGYLTAFEPAPSYGNRDIFSPIAFGAPQPSLTYSYEVQGVRFSGSTVRRGPDVSTRGTREAPGSSVRVYFNPKDPAQAVLERGYTRMVYYQLILGLSFLGLSVYWLAA